MAGDLRKNLVEIGGLDHISIVVPNLLKALYLYRESFGCAVSDPVEVPEQGVRIAYVYLTNAKLELMEPLGQNSPISNFLKKNPRGGLHHVCLTTQDVGEAVTSVLASGMNILGDSAPKTGHHGRKLFFINPKDTFGTLIEIEESVSSIC